MSYDIELRKQVGIGAGNPLTLCCEHRDGNGVSQKKRISREDKGRPDCWEISGERVVSEEDRGPATEHRWQALFLPPAVAHPCHTLTQNQNLEISLIFAWPSCHAYF